MEVRRFLDVTGTCAAVMRLRARLCALYGPRDRAGGLDRWVPGGMRDVCTALACNLRTLGLAVEEVKTVDGVPMIASTWTKDQLQLGQTGLLRIGKRYATANRCCRGVTLPDFGLKSEMPVKAPKVALQWFHHSTRARPHCAPRKNLYFATFTISRQGQRRIFASGLRLLVALW